MRLLARPRLWPDEDPAWDAWVDEWPVVLERMVAEVQLERAGWTRGRGGRWVPDDQTTGTPDPELIALANLLPPRGEIE